MVDVDSLSDAQLRTKLLEYGYPVMPITNTTRKIMVKKLKLLMDGKGKANTDGRRSLSRYSSEEESDTDTRTKKKEKNRRVTMGGPAMQPPTSNKLPVKRVTQRFDYANNVDAPVVTKKEKIVSSTKIVKTHENDFDTGSDSEPEAETSNDFSFKRVETSSPAAASLRSPLKLDNRDVLSKQPPSRYTMYSSPSTTASEYAADRLNSIRSRLSLGTPVGDRPSYTSAESFEPASEEPETPFLSNFTKRLSQITAEKKGDDYRSDYLKENDSNGSGYNVRTYLNRPLRARDYARSYANKENNSKNNLVSFTVIGLAFLFFVVVGMLYLGLHSGNYALETTGHEVPYCNADRTKIGFDCIVTDEYPLAANMFRLLQPELHRRAVAHRCDGRAPKPHMTERDLISFVAANTEMKDELAIQKHLRSFQVLVFSNPLWGISVVYGEDADHMGNVPIESMEEMVSHKQRNEIALTMLNPDLPWSCSLYLKVARAFNAILLLTILTLTAYGGNVAFKHYKQYEQREKDELFRMVGRIVDILQSSATDDAENNYLVINHVRDMILPLKDRNSMQKIWTKAVRFINENDSRIRTEIQVVQGEPYQVWRWLGAPNLNASRNKSWQGQAFETQVGSVNSLQCSPTQCLKIRGMIEDGDRDLVTIREAVLSKCAHQCRILHCAVDWTSKCVYLKCADQNDAAIAYRNLHGWWYAGHLVTVKYLRLERYMHRYPDSPVSGPAFLRAIQPATDWSN